MNNVFKETLEYLRDYYLDLNDYIERFSFPRMDYYYLLINISSFYRMIDCAFYYLKKYEENNDELYLVYTLIFVPKKIKFTNVIYDNFGIIKMSLDYNNYALEKYKED